MKIVSHSEISKSHEKLVSAVNGAKLEGKKKQVKLLRNEWKMVLVTAHI